MERCTRCHFLFEPAGGNLTDCPQCEQDSAVVVVESIRCEFDAPLPPPTLKFGTGSEQ